MLQLAGQAEALTTVNLITHVSAVWSVVTQVFHQDTCPITTPVLIWHAGSDAGCYYKRRKGKEEGEAVLRDQ